MRVQPVAVVDRGLLPANAKLREFGHREVSSDSCCARGASIGRSEAVELLI